jgi:hypothetical protein
MRVSNALCDAAAVGYLGYDRMTKGNSSEVRQNMPLAVSTGRPDRRYCTRENLEVKP